MTPDTSRIRDLNDRFRTTFIGGEVFITAGVRACGQTFQSRAVELVQTFEAFTPENDPYGEHDFGSFQIEGRKVFWKIDYYNADLTAGSENPTDSGDTRRVLTILLAEEW